MSKRFRIVVAIVQAILLAGHAFIFATAIIFFPLDPLATGLILALLAFTFVSATLLAHRFHSPLTQYYYHFAAVWLGLGHLLLMASMLAWVALGLAYLVALATGPITAESMELTRLAIGSVTLGIALAVALYAFTYAVRLQTVRYTVRIPDLPPAWRGRRLVWASDIHLGNINSPRFAARVTDRINRLKPDIIILGGDLFDGTDGQLHRLIEPCTKLSAPLGVYFITGNHEEFFNKQKFLAPIHETECIRLIENDAIDIDNLRIIGVDYRDTTNPQRYAEILAPLVPNGRPSILLKHDPHFPEIPAELGVSLQLSGHTHRGQIFPFMYITDRVYGRHDYGLSHRGDLTVITSSGAGTWGPPMRLGTRSEILEITFE